MPTSQPTARRQRARAIVIGAGIGGLVAAIDLLARGLDVTILEKAPLPGGKMREVNIQGQSIDSGPTVLTMPWVFEEVFGDAGSSIDNYLDLQPTHLLARHGWSDGSQLDLFSDPELSARAIAELAGHAEAERFRTFCRQAQRVYETLYKSFMRSQRPGPLTLVRAAGWRGLPDLWRIQPFRTLWQSLRKQFRDPRLISLFARYATYCGSSPLLAPATLMLIAHVEQRGVWQITGGMQGLAEALATLVKDKGGIIRYGNQVAQVNTKNGQATGVNLSSGETLPADAVIANADLASIQAGQLGQAAAAALPTFKSPKRSLSAVTWSLLAETSGLQLAHHNVFFPENYPQEFTDIFKHQRLPDKPAVYVCAQNQSHGQSHQSEAERLFIIVNAPANGDRVGYDTSGIDQLESVMLDQLAQCGLHVAIRPNHRVITTPADFEQRFPGTGGALYGLATHGWRSSFARPGARSGIRRLYLAGGSVHPGAGVPMVAISGRLAAQAAALDLGLQAPC